MSEFVMSIIVLTVFLGFIFAVFCKYNIEVKSKDNEAKFTKDSINNEKE